MCCISQAIFLQCNGACEYSENISTVNFLRLAYVDLCCYFALSFLSLAQFHASVCIMTGLSLFYWSNLDLLLLVWKCFFCQSSFRASTCTNVIEPFPLNLQFYLLFSFIHALPVYAHVFNRNTNTLPID